MNCGVTKFVWWWPTRAERLRNGCIEEINNFYDRCRAHRAVVKQAMKVAKRMANWRFGERSGNDFGDLKYCRMVVR